MGPGALSIRRGGVSGEELEYIIMYINVVLPCMDIFSFVIGRVCKLYVNISAKNNMTKLRMVQN